VRFRSGTDEQRVARRAQLGDDLGARLRRRALEVVDVVVVVVLAQRAVGGGLAPGLVDFGARQRLAVLAGEGERAGERDGRRGGIEELGVHGDSLRSKDK
jgi:hypothetical protein